MFSMHNDEEWTQNRPISMSRARVMENEMRPGCIEFTFSSSEEMPPSHIIAEKPTPFLHAVVHNVKKRKLKHAVRSKLRKGWRPPRNKFVRPGVQPRNPRLHSVTKVEFRGGRRRPKERNLPSVLKLNEPL